MSRNSDREIIEAIRTGANSKVLAVLYKEYLPRVKRLIRQNSGTEDDAKDIFQDTVISLFNQVKLNKYDEQKEVGGFIYTVAKNLWINKVKRDNRSVQLVDTEQWEDERPSPLSSLMHQEKAKVIQEVMDKIGEECKKMLKFTLYDKMSLRDVAAQMGYSSEMVAKTYHYRCKQKLVNLVKDKPWIIKLFRDS